MSTKELYVISLVGDNPQIVYEIVRCIIQNAPLCLVEDLGTFTTINVIAIGSSSLKLSSGQDSKEDRGNDDEDDEDDEEDGGNDDKEDYIDHVFGAIKKLESHWSINCQYCTINKTEKVNNSKNSSLIGEGILRLLIQVNQQKKAEDEICLSIAGGRKTMAALANLGQFLLPINKILHLVVDDDRSGTLEDLEDNWDTYYPQDCDRSRCLHPIVVPLLSGWDKVFSEFLLGLGKKLSLEYYPLEENFRNSICNGDGEELGIRIDYEVDNNVHLLEDIQIAGSRVGRVVSLGASAAFHAFDHDLKEVFTVLSNPEKKDEEKDVPLQTVQMINRYIQSLYHMQTLVNDGELEDTDRYTFSNIADLWTPIIDIVAILSKGKTILEPDSNAGEVTWNDKNITFSIKAEEKFKERDIRLVKPTFLYTVYRNLIRNMIVHGEKGGQITIEVGDESVVVTSSNKVKSNFASDKFKKIVKEGTIGLPYLQRNQLGRGMGLYLIRVIYFIFNGHLTLEDIGKIFRFENNEFSVRMEFKLKGEN